ncbi:MAG: response regulator [Treponema sp.]|jgi:two-component system response regulator YesN|nr:response regulator [Treponema sp.]
MYRIVLAEDEPAAAENIADIIRLHCPQFEIAASADNGQSCLELIRQYRPDLLFTDIRMPGMDGLQLAMRIHGEMPSVRIIIISGYQDFEYARTAIQHGVVDYLLKPITPAALKSSLERIIPMLDETKGQRRLTLVHRLFNQDIPDKSELADSFPMPRYSAAISRKNGLPCRFFHTPYFNSVSNNYKIDGYSIEVYGRDEMECLHISPASSSGDALFATGALERIQWMHKDIPGYTTMVVWPHAFPIEELSRVLKALYTALDSHIVIGKTQTIMAAAKYLMAVQNVPPDHETRRLFAHYAKERKFEQIQRLLMDQVKQWEAEQQPQLFVEKELRLFLEQLRAETEGSLGRSDDQFEFMFEDAFFYATNCREFCDSLIDILEKILPTSLNAVCKVDTPEFFDLIEKYISAHLAKPLSLQGLCGHFGVSQTYISRIFRKYTGQSFINYLTLLRIEKAKHLLARKDMLVKDAAALTGFADQFYFSRVFRSVTGVSPSEWIRE